MHIIFGLPYSWIVLLALIPVPGFSTMGPWELEEVGDDSWFFRKIREAYETGETMEFMGSKSC